MGYVELRCRSAFSFMEGACTPEALLTSASDMGYTALGLCDAAELGGSVRFALEARERKIRPIIGAELRVDGRPLALLVRDKEGYRNLSALVTLSRVDSRRGLPGVRWAEMAERAAGLHLLTGCAEGALSKLLRAGRPHDAERLLGRWRERFENRIAVEVQTHLVSGAERALAGSLADLAGRADIPWVVTNQPRYLDEEGRLINDIFTALRSDLTVDEAAARGLLLPNGEWRLKSPADMEAAWARRPDGIDESARIAAACSFEPGWLRPELPRVSDDDDAMLRAEVYRGAAVRWGAAAGSRQHDKIEHELAVIRNLGFASFFLIMQRAVRYAKSNGILCQGRGSAANSVVAFCLEITAVDPVANNLLFERFLSEARTDGLTEAPDIDVDFEMHRREEVLDYIYSQYDRDHAAITAVTQVYHAPSALQDAMRGLGYPPEQAFSISKRMHHREPTDGAALLEDALAARFDLDLDTPRGRALLSAMRALDGVPRMRSTHPGGFVLSERPLGEYMPIERTTMGRTILQFDKDDLDLVGIPKFDFLGLGGLTAIRIAFDSIEKRTGSKLDLYNLPENDPATFRMISKGDTIGTFQIESRAQIQSILQTLPEVLYDLVVQVALIRPGPIQGEFVSPYTRRRRGLDEWSHAHPDLAPILDRTYGIPIFQEQAMSIAMALGGYSAAEADQLRRSMGHRRKQKRLEAALLALRARLVERGLGDELAGHIISQMKGFANYGFPESHAWSFALIAYATAYLKCHYPADFLMGLLNAWPMGFYAPATLVHEARRTHGVESRPPCLKGGRWECTLEEGDTTFPAVRIGWKHVRGMGKSALDRLREAGETGQFGSVDDVIRRARLSRAEALHLARAGAFEQFEPGRRQAAWDALRAAGDVLPLAPARRLPFDAAELEGNELIFLDYLATGICTHGHPMEHLRERLDSCGIRSSRGLLDQEDGVRIVVAGLVIARQHPSTSKGTVFALLEDEFGFINVIVPARLYEKHKDTVNDSSFLVVEGRFERAGEAMNVVGFRFRELPVRSIAFRSHDFH
jgi:error-prone DNA polymerase